MTFRLLVKSCLRVPLQLLLYFFSFKKGACFFSQSLIYVSLLLNCILKNYSMPCFLNYGSKMRSWEELHSWNIPRTLNTLCH
uniref:Uncharacterized protein n=1 Tax=Arundo donax TaxID=35708 RepID=A0A0A9FPB3_ARUDO